MPSPADDFKEVRISLDRELIKNKESTFYAKVSGNSMEEAGLNDGDLIVFPGWVPHDVGPNTSNKQRINIAFNISFNVQFMTDGQEDY